MDLVNVKLGHSSLLSPLSQTLLRRFRIKRSYIGDILFWNIAAIIDHHKTVLEMNIAYRENYTFSTKNILTIDDTYVSGNVRKISKKTRIW